MSRKSQVQIVLDFILRLEGVSSVDVKHGSKHIKVRFKFKGHNLVQVCSATPGGGRGQANALAMTKRLLRGAGWPG
jgi:hypothetical protein